MGKNKQKHKKDTSVFKVAGSKVNKAKQKTKPIATNLKRINIQNKTKTVKADEKFNDVQGMLLSEAKQRKDDKKKNKAAVLNVQKTTPQDIGAAADELAKL